MGRQSGRIHHGNTTRSKEFHQRHRYAEPESGSGVGVRCALRLEDFTGGKWEIFHGCNRFCRAMRHVVGFRQRSR